VNGGRSRSTAHSGCFVICSAVGPHFLEMSQREAGAEQQVDVAADRAMALDHAFGQPVGRTVALLEIAIERPDAAALGGGDEAWCGGRGVERVLHREDEGRTRHQRTMDQREAVLEVDDVVQGKRAIGEIEGRRRHVERFQIAACVGDDRIVGHLRGAREHLRRHVDGEDRGGTFLPRPARESAEAAAEVEHARACHRRQRRPDHRLLGGTFEPVHRTRQSAVAGEEVFLVVDVLGHRVLD
jgi:hypothetical protein